MVGILAADGEMIFAPPPEAPRAYAEGDCFIVRGCSAWLGVARSDGGYTPALGAGHMPTPHPSRNCSQVHLVKADSVSSLGLPQFLRYI